jgi:hypothetical protein
MKICLYFIPLLAFHFNINAERVNYEIQNSDYILFTESSEKSSRDTKNENIYSNAITLKIGNTKWERPIWTKYLIRSSDIMVNATGFISILGAIEVDEKVYFIYNDSGVLLIETIELRMMRWITTNVSVLSEKFNLLTFESCKINGDSDIIEIEIITTNGLRIYSMNLFSNSISKSE